MRSLSFILELLEPLRHLLLLHLLLQPLSTLALKNFPPTTESDFSLSKVSPLALRTTGIAATAPPAPATAGRRCLLRRLYRRGLLQQESSRQLQVNSASRRLAGVWLQRCCRRSRPICSGAFERQVAAAAASFHSHSTTFLPLPHPSLGPISVLTPSPL